MGDVVDIRSKLRREMKETTTLVVEPWRIIATPGRVELDLADGTVWEFTPADARAWGYLLLRAAEAAEE